MVDGESLNLIVMRSDPFSRRNFSDRVEPENTMSALYNLQRIDARVNATRACGTHPN